MSHRELLAGYYRILVALYNNTLNMLAHLENRDLTAALEVQKVNRELTEQAESMLDEISAASFAIDEDMKAEIEQAITMHHRIELLTQQCECALKNLTEELREKMQRIHRIREMAESQHRPPSPIARA